MSNAHIVHIYLKYIFKLSKQVVFTKIEMNKEWNANFLQFSLLII